MDARGRAMSLAVMAAKMDVTDVMGALGAQEAALMIVRATAQPRVAHHAWAHAKDALVAQAHAMEVVFNHAQEIVPTHAYRHVLEPVLPLAQETAQDVPQHALLTAQETALMTV